MTVNAEAGSLLIVFFGIALLAEVQLRSSGGATFDTWRLNYEANRVLNANLVKNLKTANKKARDDANSLTGNEACLRFFDESGIPKLALLDEETAKEVAPGPLVAAHDDPGWSDNGRSANYAARVHDPLWLLRTHLTWGGRIRRSPKTV